MAAKLPRERLDSARQVFASIHHVVIATASADAQPHNTPVFGTFDDAFNMFWASSPQSVHSQNIAANPAVFIVVFNSQTGKGGGVYIKAHAQQLDQEADIAKALAVIKNKTGRDVGGTERFIGQSPQRFYRANPEGMWVNMSEKDDQGHIIIDRRYQIEPKDLL
jgi:hypothetical protein